MSFVLATGLFGGIAILGQIAVCIAKSEFGSKPKSRPKVIR